MSGQSKVRETAFGILNFNLGEPIVPINYIYDLLFAFSTYSGTVAVNDLIIWGCY